MLARTNFTLKDHKTIWESRVLHCKPFFLFFLVGCPCRPGAHMLLRATTSLFVFLEAFSWSFRWPISLNFEFFCVPVQFAIKLGAMGTPRKNPVSGITPLHLKHAIISSAPVERTFQTQWNTKRVTFQSWSDRHVRNSTVYAGSVYKRFQESAGMRWPMNWTEYDGVPWFGAVYCIGIFHVEDPSLGYTSLQAIFFLPVNYKSHIQANDFISKPSLVNPASRLIII